MRGKVAKLLHRVAHTRAIGLGDQTKSVPLLGALKWAWVRTSRPMRGAVRVSLEKEIGRD